MSQRRKVTGPYFPFYAKDWLVSTAGLSFGAKGLYIDLLSIQWDQFIIPLSVDDVCRKVRTTRAIFDPLWREIAIKFREQKRGRSNRRLERERGVYRDYIDQRREAGKRSAQSRAKRPPPVPEISASVAQQPAAQPLAPVSVNPHHQPTNLINGASMRRHGTHAWCSFSAGRDGLCVPQFLHEELLGKSAKPDAELRAWYVSTVGALNGHAVGEDALVFWRNSFAGWVGTVTATPDTNSRTAQTLAGARRTMEKIQSGTREPSVFALPKVAKPS